MDKETTTVASRKNTTPLVKEVIPTVKRKIKLPIIEEKEILTLADKILNSISYKLISYLKRN